MYGKNLEVVGKEMSEKIKLSSWAKLHSVSYQTAHNMFKAGKLRATQLPTGTILVEDDPKTSCVVMDQNTKKSFNIDINIDLNGNKFTGEDQKEILDAISHLAELLAEKLKFGVILKKWTP